MTSFDPRTVGRSAPSTLVAVGFRNQAPSYDIRSGEGARRFGGRYNPPHSFPVLYLCTSRSCVVAELTRQAKRQNLDIASLLPRELWRVEAELDKVLDLTAVEVLSGLGVSPTDLIQDDLHLTRAIGEAAYEQRFQGILTRSATGIDNVLVILLENLAGTLLDCTVVEHWIDEKDVARPDPCSPS